MDFRLQDLLEAVRKSDLQVNWLGPEKDLKTLEPRTDLKIGDRVYRAARRGGIPAELITLPATEVRALFKSHPNAVRLVAGGAADVGYIKNGAHTYSAYRPWADGESEKVQGQIAGKYDELLLKVRANRPINFFAGLSSAELHILWSADAFFLPYRSIRDLSACLESEYGVSVFSANLLICEPQ